MKLDSVRREKGLEILGAAGKTSPMMEVETIYQGYWLKHQQTLFFQDC
jgi:hypothetical protein